MSKRNASSVKNVINNLDNIRNISIIAHIDSGKCFGKGTPIMMSDGSTKNVETVNVGDYVMGHNMKAGYVTALHSGLDTMYRVDQGGSKLTYDVNSRHMLVFELSQDYLIETNKLNKTAKLYYFEHNKLCTISKHNTTLFDTYYLDMMASIISTASALLNVFPNITSKDIARKGSWIYISMKDYINLPDTVKHILKGIQLDQTLYNETGEYKYTKTDINITILENKSYYGFEVKSNPLFMLSDGTVVHNSTLSDSLITKAGFIAADKAGKVCITDTREDEKARGITIKACSVSLHHTLPDHIIPRIAANQPTVGNEFLINLIDSPGHVDFSSEVTAALRVTDGAVVVVECIAGVSVQTETVVRQSIQENIELVLMINKMDRAMVEQQLEPESLYQRFNKIIQDMNVLVSIYGGNKYSDNYFDPLKGNVVFGAAYHGWAFNLRNFADMYAKINGANSDELVKKLWGEQFINTKSKWGKTPSTNNVRGFVKLILEPIYLVYSIKTQKAKFEPILEKVKRLGVVLSAAEIEKSSGDDILRAIMRKWLPAGDAVMEMIIEHLPSPKTAQKYRGKDLYTGDMDSEIGQAIINCDPNGPMTMFVSKMFPASDNRFYAFGRVFSGTIRSGQKIKIMGGNYVFGESKDLVQDKPIQRVVLMMANKTEAMNEVPCGNIVGLVGIDQYMIKTGTLSDSPDAHPIKPMTYSVSPVVRVAVEPVDIKDMSKLQLAMKRLAKSDPLVQCIQSDTGENIIAGAGELHIEICLHDLRELAGIEIRQSEPVVPYCETIINPSMVCYSKSGSGLNRILIKAQPVPYEMVNDIESKKLSLKQTNKDLTRTIITNYGFDITDFKRLWGFGAEEATNTNVITDDSKGVEYLDKVKGSIISAFESTSTRGVLAGEPLRGVQFKLVDASIHGDAAHRGADEIIPPTRKAILASMISGGPRLVEPVYRCEIYCPTEEVGTIYSFISQRRGTVYDEQPILGNPMTIMNAYLPVAESFGFTNKLRELTHGKAFPTCVFDHWEVIDSDPYEEGSYANTLVTTIRKRKGMAPELPDISKFIDKMPKDYADRYST